MKLENLDQVEAWSGGAMLPVGWHNVTIEEAAESTSSGGYPQLELELAGQAGSIRDWIVLIESTKGKIKQVLEAAGIEVQPGEWEFDPKSLRGKEVRVNVGEEPDYKDPSKMRRRVQAYAVPSASDVPIDESNGSNAVADDEKLPF